jgi:hypothetical protein
MAEIIEIQTSGDIHDWTPFVGDETTGLLRSKGFANVDGILDEGGQRVLDETYRIMQVCGNPNQATNNDTGIVIGYVQSGKTLSFTTLTALARDNNYQIVIVIAGTTTPLVNQSTDRVRKDLRVNNRYGFDQKWTQIKNPNSQGDLDLITGVLAQWADPTFSNDRCKTILITVMKNGSHLRNLTDLLSDINLSGVPTLIIDDESDQASLNTRARWAARQGLDIETLSENEVSTIYRRITNLRSIFPHHTFLQYTATPQANLFINIVDRLSPNFIKLLTPGSDYTGGIQFFKENPNLIREIPLNSVPNTHEPPDALLEALRFFYLGVAAGTVLELYKLPGQHNRSMLIHPSRLQGDHTTFYGWVNTIKESWRRLLSGNDEDEKSDLLRDFMLTYNDLQMTVPNLPSFETLTGNNLIHAIQYTPIVEVNSRQGATPQINWPDSYSWILVGGQSMDRGFTVEGLTVTYMPRNIGVGNVDTIQQRARFFGYKRGYLGYCRVFLDQVTIDAYTNIVDHEEDVRNRLVDFDINNKHLNDWDREAVLDQMLNLTRANVLYDDLDRDQFGNDWFRINAPHDTVEHIETNRNAVFDFLNPKSESFMQDEGHANRTEEQKHLVATISMKDCLEHLLNKLKFTRESDSARYSSLRGIIKRYSEENSDENCQVYLMTANSLTDWKSRVRRLNRNDEIQQLFQGRNPRTGEVVYPGDSEIKNENVLTIQIHMLNIRDTEYVDVPTLAIWIPESMGQDIIRQA